MSTEQNSDNSEKALRIGGVSKRYFEFTFVDNGYYRTKTIQGSDFENARNNLRKSLTGLFSIVEYREVNAC